MNPDHRKDWLELCKAAAKEQNPEKLLELILALNKALDDREQRRLANNIEVLSYSNWGHSLSSVTSTPKTTLRIPPQSKGHDLGQFGIGRS